MIIQFTCNIPGITRTSVAFSMEAASIRSVHLEEGTGIIFLPNDLQVLRTSALLGLSSSVNVVLFDELKKMLSAMGSESIIPDLEGERELIWLKDGIRYRYGFDVRNGRINAEWFYYKDKRETYIFSKREDLFEVNNRYKDLTELVKRHLAGPTKFLFGTAVTLFPEGLSDLLPHDFVTFCDRESLHQTETVNLSSDMRKALQTYLKQGDPSFESVSLSSRGIATVRHLIFKYKNCPALFFHDLDREIQDEILVILVLLGSLKERRTLILTGLWDMLNPLLQRGFLRMYNSPADNPMNSQLILTTLNPYSIFYRFARRDQIWLSQKSEDGTLQMLSLCDFRGSGELWRKGRFPEAWISGELRLT